MYYQNHPSRLLRTNYTKLFKQIMLYSSETMISSQSRTTPKLQPYKYVKVEGQGRAGMRGRQARKNQDKPPKHRAHSGAKLTAVQSRKSHTLATPELLLFFSPPAESFADQRGGNYDKPCHTLRNVSISIATICVDLPGSLYTSGKIQRLAKPVSFSISVLVFQFQKTLLPLNCCGSQ